MSHHKLREDKTCLNCGNAVDDHYCPHCGQENVETRQSFGALLAHFIEDFTHYEGKFWRTIKYLLFRPAYLSREFLAGKRISYLPPVRLYIFMSFITFLLPHLLPEFEEVRTEYTPQQQALLDSIRNDSFSHFTFHNELGFIYSSPYKTIAQLDSARTAKKGTTDELSWLGYWNGKKAIELKKYSPRDLEVKFAETLAKSTAKSLFIYMPLFALVLWLFHGKRKWMYFDHAIYTLHYFSFVLIMACLITLLFCLSDWMLSAGLASVETMDSFDNWVWLVVFAAIGYYFYRAHRKMYEESWGVSFFKATATLIINILFFAVIIFCTVLASVAMIH